MPVIYGLRGKVAEFCELGINLYSGCAIGCRYCAERCAPPHDVEGMDHPRSREGKSSLELKRDAKKMEGDLREIFVCPAGDPYQSDGRLD